MPFHLFAATAPFEIQFGMVEFHIGSEQVFGHIHKGALAGKFPVSVMEVGGRVQSSNARLCGTVAGLQIEAFVLAFDIAALLDEVSGHGLKFAEPALVNQLINADEALSLIHI